MHIIRRKQLIAPVIITGHDFIGKLVTITFTPHDQTGWWWETKDNGILPIDHRIARYKKGRIQLFAGQEILNVWEHIGAIRFLGIDGVKVSMDSDNRPPYLTAGQYASYFDGKTQLLNELIPTMRPTEEYEYSYSSRETFVSQVAIKKSSKLSLHVLSQWEDLPETTVFLEEEDLFKPDFLKNVFDAKPQGLTHRKIFAKLAQLIFKWPHFNNVAWKSDFNLYEDAAYAFWLHAVQDALGEMSLASHTALPLGMFSRFKTGHKQMLRGIKKSFS